MILPAKHLGNDRALLGIGADILACLEEPTSVSELWESVRTIHRRKASPNAITFDWFVLALTLLYATGAIDAAGGTVFARGR